MTNGQVVTRFAPSPTGFLHLGNVRTALLNWLFARQQSGRFLLRFEDTDRSRSSELYERAIMEDLDWLGLHWDGKPGHQSERSAIHQQALCRLAEQGHAYRCFCSERQLELDRKLAASRGLPPRYVGRCRHLARHEAESRAMEGEPFVWRLAARDTQGKVELCDLLRDRVCFERSDLDDPVLVRSDGRFTFLLPNALDDALDGITHVLRGDDHLTNSAYQVLMLHELGHMPPVYVHHGLLLGADGAKLSKRTGGTSVRELREQGLLPMALVQAMARLGHPNMPDDLDLQTLIRSFDIRRLSTSAVRWDPERMWRWHARLIHESEPETLLPAVRERLPQADAEFVRLIQANLERFEDALKYRRLLDPHASLSREAMDVARQAGVGFYRTAVSLWEEDPKASDWRTWTSRLGGQTGLKGRDLFLPLRVALTGALAGPEMRAVVDYLGYEGVRDRMRTIMEVLES